MQKNAAQACAELHLPLEVTKEFDDRHHATWNTPKGACAIITHEADGALHLELTAAHIRDEGEQLGLVILTFCWEIRDEMP